MLFLRCFFIAIVATCSLVAKEDLKILLIGPPGVGKGYQANILSEKLSLPILSASSALRDEQLPEDIRKSIAYYMDQGLLVPDALVNKSMASVLSQDRYKRGVILDGYPRTVKQADFLNESGFCIDAAIVYHLDQETLLKRLSGRLIEPVSGRVYHEVFNPPKIAGKDDLTGRALIKRRDDTVEVVSERLKVYESQTEPVIAWLDQHQGHGVGMVVYLDASDQPETLADKTIKVLSTRQTSCASIDR